jgi:DNA invertase Pin-like site-specific DNA recombinase
MSPRHSGKYISYLRVSTDKQGVKGLGIEAQREAVQNYLDGGRWKLVGEFIEQESGKQTDRPQLNKALSQCRLHNATLVVAKLDRLARNAEFLLQVVRESGERGVVFCDLPDIPEGSVGKLMLTTMAGIAEFEARRISERTKAALAVLKAKGKRLGTPHPRKIAKHSGKGARASAAIRSEKARQRASDLKPVFEDLRQRGVTTLPAMARALNEAGHTAPRGGKWYPMTVKLAMNYLEA